MHLGAVNRMITKLTFRFVLLKRAYTRSEIEKLVSQTKFASVGIEEAPIGLEIMLHKAGTNETLSQSRKDRKETSAITECLSVTCSTGFARASCEYRAAFFHWPFRAPLGPAPLDRSAR